MVKELLRVWILEGMSWKDRNWWSGYGMLETGIRRKFRY